MLNVLLMWTCVFAGVGLLFVWAFRSDRQSMRRQEKLLEPIAGDRGFKLVPEGKRLHEIGVAECLPDAFSSALCRPLATGDDGRTIFTYWTISRYDEYGNRTIVVLPCPTGEHLPDELRIVRRGSFISPEACERRNPGATHDANRYWRVEAADYDDLWLDAASELSRVLCMMPTEVRRVHVVAGRVAVIGTYATKAQDFVRLLDFAVMIRDATASDERGRGFLLRGGAARAFRS